MKKLNSKTTLNLFNMKERKEYFMDNEDIHCRWTIGIIKENDIITIKYYDYIKTIENKKDLDLYSIMDPLEVQELANNWNKIKSIVSKNMCIGKINISDIRKVNLYNFVNIVLSGLECDWLLNFEVIKEF